MQLDNLRDKEICLKQSALYIFAFKPELLKKISGIALLLTMAFCQVGYYFLMRNSQESIKETMREKVLSLVKDEELSIISYSDNQNKIYWDDEEGKKEFSFKGEMYDVVKKVTVNGKVLLYCIDDTKEQQLINKYNSITKNNSAAGKKAKNDSNNSINLFIYEDQTTDLSYFPSTTKQFNVFVSRLAKGVAHSVSPPPKAV